MSPQSVVLSGTRFQMLNHRLTTVPTATLNVAAAERTEQQFRLVQPGATRRSQTNANPRLAASEHRQSVTSDVAGSVVHHQVDALRPRVTVQHLLERRAKVLAVVAFQALGPHPTIMDGHRGQKVHRPVTHVVKRLLLDLAGNHASRWPVPFQDLQIGHLIETDDEYATFQEPVDTLVAPQQTARSLDRRRIPQRRLPIAPAMGLQRSCGQDAGHRRIVNRVENLLSGNFPLQGPCRPMGQAQPVLSRL